MFPRQNQWLPAHWEGSREGMRFGMEGGYENRGASFFIDRAKQAIIAHFLKSGVALLTKGAYSYVTAFIPGSIVDHPSIHEN